jgi:hypothetical protein
LATGYAARQRLELIEEPSIDSVRRDAVSAGGHAGICGVVEYAETQRARFDLEGESRIHEQDGFVERFPEKTMSAIRRLLVIVPLAFILATSEAPAFSGSERVEVPITQTRLSDGMIRYSVPVSIGGGAPIEAMLDTGSFGLRVLTKAVSSSQYTASDIRRPYPYASGARLRGFIATGVIGIGEATTPSAVGLQVVETVDCVESKPKCPVSKIKPEEYGIGGDGLPNEGFQAILGISMRQPPVRLGAINPLTAIGSRSWIVILPQRGDSAPGQLIINPTPADTEGFKLYQMERQPVGENPGWKDTTIPACTKPPEENCSTRIDTGGSIDTIKPFWSYAIFFNQNAGTIGVKAR